MSLTEEMIRQQVAHSPNRYAKRVQMLAGIYFVLDLISIGVLVAIAWRIQYFVIITQRTNIETLTLAIIFVLAAYYLITTFGGFVGAIRMLWYNFPTLWTKDSDSLERVERRKQAAMKPATKPKAAFFDKAVVIKGKTDKPIKWDLRDEAGNIGSLTIDGVKVTLEPEKDGINNSVFEFLASGIENCLKDAEPDFQLQITQWSTIDKDQASAYYSMVKAFQNLEQRLGEKGPIWPTVELDESDIRKIGNDLRELLPALRNEAFLPDLEYRAEFNVPILPEPLGFMRLTRTDNRADPVVTMGCAGIIMVVILALIVLFIVFPPWIPPR